MTKRVDRLMEIGVLGYIVVSLTKVLSNAGESSAAGDIVVSIVVNLAKGIGG